MYNERFQGEGFPDWATINEVPPTNLFGFPGNYFTPAVMRAFDNLWTNAELRTHYAESWRRVAAHFASKRNVIGYDLMNEPWAGTQWATCANPIGCPVFSNLFLQPFMEQSAAAIREAGGTGVVFWEPDVTNDFGAGNSVGLARPFADPNNGISFHPYCLIGGLAPGISREDDPACPVQESLTYRQQATASSRNGSALLVTEFGASDELADIARVAELADQNMVGWTYWHYGSWSDPTGNPSAEGMFAGDLQRPGSLKQPKADVLIRTYPQAIAGRPVSFSFDPESKAFTLVFDADPAIDAPTQIFVPVARHYGGHYTVSVEGPASVTSLPDASLLTLVDTGEGRVTVRIAAA
jgi:endoglycosylceramidase